MRKRGTGTILYRVFFNITLSVLFVVALSFALLTAYGYRIDPSKITIVESGLLDLSHVSPGATISLNRVSQNKKTPTKITDLEITDYQLTLSKDNFYPWTKKISVRSNLITNVGSLKLVPHLDPERLFSYRSASNFCVSKNGLVALFDPQATTIHTYNQNGQPLSTTTSPRETLTEMYWQDGKLYFRSGSQTWQLDNDTEWHAVTPALDPNLDPAPVLSPSYQKSLQIKGYEIWYTDLSEDQSYLVSRFSAEPVWTRWYTESQIIFATADEIQICDTDGQNAVTLTTYDATTTPVYLSSLSRIYYLQDGTAKTINLSDSRPGLLQSFFGY